MNSPPSTDTMIFLGSVISILFVVFAAGACVGFFVGSCIRARKAEAPKRLDLRSSVLKPCSGHAERNASLL
jgi:hypothetical protein